jgi:carbamoyl-phosphate synthase large subunit
MKKPTLTIAVTGLNAIDSPGPGVAVIRALRDSDRFDTRIIGLSYESLEPGIYMHDLVDRSYQIPYPSTGHGALLQRLEYIHEQEKLDVIIPNFDAELYTFIKLQDSLSRIGIRTVLPTLAQFEARMKGNLYAFGKEHGILVPESASILTVNELGAALRAFAYPVVVKGKFYEAYIARSYEQAVSYFYKISAKWGTPIILQQFIAGEEFNVCGLGDGTGKVIGAVPMRKTYITSQGKAWGGISIEDEDLLEMTRKFVSATNWCSGFELELMKEKDTGRVYLLEINPRFPAWVYLTVGAGQNQPEALIRLAMGEKVAPYTDYEVGKMFIRYSWDMICELSDFEKISTQGEL